MTPPTDREGAAARAFENPCMASMATSEPCQPDAHDLRRCTICGFVVDLAYAAEKPAPERGPRPEQQPAARAYCAECEGTGHTANGIYDCELCGGTAIVDIEVRAACITIVAAARRVDKRAVTPDDVQRFWRKLNERRPS